jgi:four helix bundle protein
VENKSPAKSFEDLVVWQKAHQFVLGIYKITENFPKSEIYGITSQLRRAAVSVPANITEGFKKRGIPDKKRYMNIAQGSLEESHYYLILIKDLKFIAESDFVNLVQAADEIGKMLNVYSQKIGSYNS